MHQNDQKTVKTSELEDQDAVILGLVIWPEETQEIHFSNRIGLHKDGRQNNANKESKLS